MDQILLSACITESKRHMETDKLFHDFAHAKSVLINAEWLTTLVGGDDVVIYTACLFHDIARDHENHDAVGANMVREILSAIREFPKHKIEEVALAVYRHDIGQVTHNEKVLSDADKMDAFTELGLARSMMMAAKRGLTLREGINSYVALLEKWSECFYFGESRKRVRTLRENIMKTIDPMLRAYTG